MFGVGVGVPIPLVILGGITCLKLLVQYPHLFYACFAVSVITIICQITHTFEENLR